MKTMKEKIMEAIDAQEDYHKERGQFMNELGLSPEEHWNWILMLHEVIKRRVFKTLAKK